MSTTHELGSLTAAEILRGLAGRYDRRAIGDHCITGTQAFREAAQMARSEAALIAGQDGADTAALDSIAQILRGECGADQISEITQIVAATGRAVGA